VAEKGLQPLTIRILSALVLAPVALALVYLGGVAFALLVGLAAALMAIEWSRLCQDTGGLVLEIATVLAVVGAVAAAALGATVIALVATPLGAAAVLMLAATRGGRPWWAAIGVIYVALPSIALIWLRALPEIGLGIVIWLFVAVWATDSLAYFTGRGLGGPKLAPRISPNKTWSGLAGGMLGAALAGGALAAAFDLGPPLPMAGAGALVALIAQAGDLWESAVKRRFSVKDSGRLIPGHGGVLDRLDGMMSAAPALAAAMVIGGEGWLTWR